MFFGDFEILLSNYLLSNSTIMFFSQKPNDDCNFLICYKMSN